MELTAKLLTVAEGAAILRLGRTLVYELVLRGELRSIKIGRARRIPVSAVDAFIRERLGESGKAGAEAA
jgi:excisionase family DNA binding protein